MKISLAEDSIKVYYGQVDHENKRSGFGRYVSLFNGSIYEGHCRNGQQSGYGRLIQGQSPAQTLTTEEDGGTLMDGAPADKPDYYIGYWTEGLRHGYGK